MAPLSLLAYPVLVHPVAVVVQELHVHLRGVRLPPRAIVMRTCRDVRRNTAVRASIRVALAPAPVSRWVGAATALGLGLRRTDTAVKPARPDPQRAPTTGLFMPRVLEPAPVTCRQGAVFFKSLPLVPKRTARTPHGYWRGSWQQSAIQCSLFVPCATEPITRIHTGLASMRGEGRRIGPRHRQGAARRAAAWAGRRGGGERRRTKNCTFVFLCERCCMS